MEKVHVKRDDKVVVLSGKDRGKQGKVLKVFSSEGRVLIEGINVVKRHTRPRPPKVPRGGIIEKALPLSSAKVMLVCSRCGVPTRISYRKKEGQKKVRVCKKCKEEI